MDAITKEITQEHHLKHTETVDKSAPVIEDGVKIGTNPFPAVLEAVKQPHELKHAETNDKSAPLIESDVKVGENPRPQLFAELQKKTSHE